MHRRRAAHRADVAPPRARFSLRTALAALATTLLAVVIALVATSGTYAYLASSQTIALLPATGSTTATIKAGSSGLVTGGAAIALTGLYPGSPVQSADFTVASTGVSPQDLTFTTTGATVANGLTVQVAPGTCASGGTPITAGAVGTVNPAATVALCLRVGMSIDTPLAAAGSPSVPAPPASITITVTGTVP
jgi:hypothetical protein